MATLHRDAGARLALLLGAGMLLSPAGWTQTRTTRIQPTLDVQATATSNAAVATGGNQQGKKELVLSATPGVSFETRGSNTQLVGQFQLNALRFVRASQPDRVLPSGMVNLHTGVWRDRLGLDASLGANQVRATSTARASDTPNTSDSYTNTTTRLSPFARTQLDRYTLVSARLDRGVLHSSQLGPGLVERPDSYTLNDQVGLTRQPTPLGYKLEWLRQQTRVAGQSDPSLNDRQARATAMYAPFSELQLGLSAGRANTQVGAGTVSDTTWGWQAQWRPSERSQLSAQMEDRFYGRSWAAEIGHRSPWMALSLQSERIASTYATALGNVGAGGSLRGLYEAMLTTRIPDEAERSKAVDEMVARRNLSSQVSTAGDVYDVAAQVRQSTNGRLAFMGRRDVLTFAAGLTRTAPLSLANDASALPLRSSNLTKEYYFDAQINHQLTPQTAVSTGLRWTRAWATTTDTQVTTMSRDFSMRAALNTRLTPDTSATMGLKRQITHNPSTASSDESSMFVGLGHRF